MAVFKSARVTVLLPTVVLILSSMLWGLVWWPLKYLHAAGIDGLPVIAIGHAGVSLMLLPFFWRQRSQCQSGWHWLITIALLGGAANVTFNVAMLYGNVVRAMVLFYLLPVWGVLGGRLFLGEKIDFIRLSSMLLALIGAFIMLGASLELFSQFTWPDLVALLAGFLFAMNNIVFRVTTQLPVISKVTALFMGGCVLASVPLVTGWAHTEPLNINVIGLSLAIGLGWWLLATLGSQWAVTRMEAGRAAVIMVMELVTAVMSTALIGGKMLLLHEWLGVACVLIATLLEASRPETNDHAPDGTA